MNNYLILDTMDVTSINSLRELYERLLRFLTVDKHF